MLGHCPYVGGLALEIKSERQTLAASQSQDGHEFF